MNLLLVVTTLMVGGLSQVADTLATQDKGNERNMMLNAESATVPREINIGLPDTGNGGSRQHPTLRVLLRE